MEKRLSITISEKTRDFPKNSKLKIKRRTERLRDIGTFLAGQSNWKKRQQILRHSTSESGLTSKVSSNFKFQKVKNSLNDKSLEMNVLISRKKPTSNCSSKLRRAYSRFSFVKSKRSILHFCHFLKSFRT